MAFVWKLSVESYKSYENNVNKLIIVHKQLNYSDIINRHRKDDWVMWQIINANINGKITVNKDKNRPIQPQV